MTHQGTLFPSRRASQDSSLSESSTETEKTKHTKKDKSSNPEKTKTHKHRKDKNVTIGVTIGGEKRMGSWVR